MKLLLLDMPVEIQDQHLIQRQRQMYSWATFMDATHHVNVHVRRSCLESLLNDPKFKSSTQDLLRELAFAKDKHGREVIQITDECTRKYLTDRLFYCGRYDIFQGPPVHVSNTAVVVMAYDHGICAQIFQENKNTNGDLDEVGFIKCNDILGRVVKSKGNQKCQKKTWQAEFCLWDKDGSGSISEEEYLHYCRQYFGGKLKVAMKFMRNYDEYNREIKAREQLKSDFVLHQLPTVAQSVFQNHMPTLIINGNFSMANFRQVLVMPAADRSLEDVFLKERPDENKTKSLLSDVVLGIQMLHKQGLVHGDLKKLNVLRVDNQLKLIDFDASVRVGHPLGAKISSGILPPEMFHNLDNANDLIKYNTQWGQERDDVSRRKKSQKGNGTFVAKAYRGDYDVAKLPYSLVKATTANYSQHINQNVILDYIHKAATWTDEKLSQRIEAFIVEEDAQDLVKRLLVVEPTKRLSATEVLNHSYFTRMDDTSATQFKAIEKTQKTIETKLTSLSEAQVLRSQLQEQLNVHHAAISQLGCDVASGLVEASDVTVPTSFVVLPDKSLDSLNPTKVTSFLAHLWDTGKKLQTAKDHSVGAIISELNAGDPLYFYLIDEDTGNVVVPGANDSVYPIEIKARDDHSFLLMNLPLIQSSFKSLKTATMCANWLQRLHVLPSSQKAKDEKQEKTKSDWTKQVEQAIADLPEPTASFQVLKQVMDVKEPVAFVRGAALRELKQWFDKHDPSQSFAGLKRVISQQGHVVWTSEARILARDAPVDCAVQDTLDRIREKFKQPRP
ncbi:Aste57867_8593 [Aphanomyces stellatus]|uniref:Aste57867_8593 protein n=1 Tax=Aphanomyces stellatus TaxID=120398 RepID=A0A485KKT4_9STRA|nr:hypothetical protein As57867_008561 [Aphanomyces stellatus]VFT85479.1 Aste57867_8593 [Aphanomyces stellatus]